MSDLANLRVQAQAIITRLLPATVVGDQQFQAWCIYAVARLNETECRAILLADVHTESLKYSAAHAVNEVVHDARVRIAREDCQRLLRQAGDVRHAVRSELERAERAERWARR